MSGADLRIERFVVGPLLTNCYLLAAGEACWVVDPGPGVRRLLGRLGELKLSPQRILLTHGHGDHIAGAGEIKARHGGVLLCCPAGEQAMLTDAEENLSAPFGLPLTAYEPDELLRPGQELALGPLTWTVLDTAGHTPAGLSFYCPQAGVVLTGDALFAGSIGRSDIPGGDGARLIRNIRSALLTLPDATRVLPGHGEETTIALERRTNPFLAGG